MNAKYVGVRNAQNDTVFSLSTLCIYCIFIQISKHILHEEYTYLYGRNKIFGYKYTHRFVYFTTVHKSILNVTLFSYTPKQILHA